MKSNYDFLDMMLDSGLSQTIHDKLTGKLVGTVFNTACVLQDTGKSISCQDFCRYF